MAGRMTASFILKLEDQLTNGLVKLQRTFENLKRTADRLNMGGLVNVDRTLDAATNGAIRLVSALDRIERSAQRAWAGLKRMAGGAGTALKTAGERVGVVGGAAAGFSILHPIEKYADYENTLRHIAISQSLSGPAVEKEVARLTSMINHEALATGQLSTTVAKAFNDLVTSGIGVETAEKLIGAHSRAATAYNIDPELLGQAVFALNKNFGIGEHEIGGALSAMAFASKEGKFSVADFSRFLPTISATFAKLGMTGRVSADTAFAALETVRMNTGDSHTAATDLKDLMDYITAPFAQKSFKAAGVDIGKTLRLAEKAGVNPLDAVLDVLELQNKGKTPVEIAQMLGLDFHNMSARDAAVALLQHKKHFEHLRKLYAGIGEDTLDRDFITAVRAPAVQLRILTEQLAQLTRRIGEGFSPMMVKANLGLKWFGDWLATIDKSIPGGTNDALLGLGVVLAGFVGLAAVGLVMPAVITGFGLVAGLLGPAGGLILGLAALSVALRYFYNHWGDKTAGEAGSTRSAEGGPGNPREVPPRPKLTMGPMVISDTYDGKFSTTELLRRWLGIGASPAAVLDGRKGEEAYGPPKILGTIRLELAPGLLLRGSDSSGGVVFAPYDASDPMGAVLGRP